MDLMRFYSAGLKEVERATLAACEPRRGGSLLDLGCGDGRLTMAVANTVGADRVAAIEISPEAADAASARGIEIERADLCEPWPYPAESFDVVHANQVIEHVACTDHFLREIGRVLKPDGYAVVCTNNLASWHNVVALVLGMQPEPCHVSDERLVGGLMGNGPGVAHSHLRIFTSRALGGLAEYHGLRSDIAEGVAYYPLTGRASTLAARLDGRHAAYILHRLRVN